MAALMRRGIDSELANKVRGIGLTLADLGQREDDTLLALGFEAGQIGAVRAGGRPPIPRDTLVAVLWASRSVCCVCRDPDRAIVLHHVVPWADSRDHGAGNLAVLCLEHHAQAHRVGALERNLGPAEIRRFKARWEEEVRVLDPRVVLDATRVDGHHWWWFNHVRVLEMAGAMGIGLRRIPGFVGVASRGWVDAAGQISA